MIQKFRKKPIEIEAIRYDGFNYDEILEWTKEEAKVTHGVGGDEGGNGYLQHYTKLAIPTKEGEMLVYPGDFVIKEPFPTPDRNFYPCKPEMMAATYQEIKISGDEE